MANLGTQILTIFSKNPAHVVYIQTWLKKYCALNASQADQFFTDLYNAYYYFLNSQGYPFPVIDMQTGGMDAKTASLRDSIAIMTGISKTVVNQFLYAMYTGYVQSKLSKEFAFPRDPNFVTPATAAADSAKMDAAKNAATTKKAGSVAAAAALKWIPSAWKVPAEAVPTSNALLSYGIVAALAAGVVLYLSHKKED